MLLVSGHGLGTGFPAVHRLSNLQKQMSFSPQEAPLNRSYYEFENFLMFMCVIEIENFRFLGVCDDFI